MARVTTRSTTTTGEASAWLEDSVLREKVAMWKSKGYSLDDVCMSLQNQGYLIGDKQVSLKKVVHTWNAKLVEL